MPILLSELLTDTAGYHNAYNRSSALKEHDISFTTASFAVSRTWSNARNIEDPIVYWSKVVYPKSMRAKQGQINATLTGSSLKSIHEGSSRLKNTAVQQAPSDVSISMLLREFPQALAMHESQHPLSRLATENNLERLLRDAKKSHSFLAPVFREIFKTMILEGDHARGQASQEQSSLGLGVAQLITVLADAVGAEEFESYTAAYSQHLFVKIIKAVRTEVLADDSTLEDPKYVIFTPAGILRTLSNTSGRLIQGLDEGIQQLFNALDSEYDTELRQKLLTVTKTLRASFFASHQRIQFCLGNFRYHSKEATYWVKPLLLNGLTLNEQQFRQLIELFSNKDQNIIALEQFMVLAELKTEARLQLSAFYLGVDVEGVKSKRLIIESENKSKIDSKSDSKDKVKLEEVTLDSHEEIKDQLTAYFEKALGCSTDRIGTDPVNINRFAWMLSLYFVVEKPEEAPPILVTLIDLYEQVFSIQRLRPKPQSISPFSGYSELAKKARDRAKSVEAIRVIKEEFMTGRFATHFQKTRALSSLSHQLVPLLEEAVAAVEQAALPKVHRYFDRAVAGFHRTLPESDPRKSDPISLILLSRLVCAQHLTNKRLAQLPSGFFSRDHHQTVDLHNWIQQVSKNTNNSANVATPIATAPNATQPLNLTVLSQSDTAGGIQLDSAVVGKTLLVYGPLGEQQASLQGELYESAGPQLIADWMHLLRRLEQLPDNQRWDIFSSTWYQELVPLFLKLNKSVQSAAIEQLSKRDPLLNMVRYEIQTFCKVCDREYEKRTSNYEKRSSECEERGLSLFEFLGERHKVKRLIKRASKTKPDSVAGIHLAKLHYHQQLTQALDHYFAGHSDNHSDSHSGVQSGAQAHRGITALEQEALGRVIQAMVPCLHFPSPDESHELRYAIGLMKNRLGESFYWQALQAEENRVEGITMIAALQSQVEKIAGVNPSRHSKALDQLTQTYQSILKSIAHLEQQATENAELHWRVQLLQSKLVNVKSTLYHCFLGAHQAEIRDRLFTELDERLGDSLSLLLPDQLPQLTARECNGKRYTVNSDYTYLHGDPYPLLQEIASSVLSRQAMPKSAIMIAEPSRQFTDVKKSLDDWLHKALPSEFDIVPIGEARLEKKSQGLMQRFTRNRRQHDADQITEHQMKTAIEAKPLSPQLLFIPYLDTETASKKTSLSSQTLHWQGVVATLSSKADVTLGFIDPLKRYVSTGATAGDAWMKRVYNEIQKYPINVIQHPLQAPQQSDYKLCGPLLVHIAETILQSWAESEPHQLPTNMNQDIDGVQLRLDQMLTLDRIEAELNEAQEGLGIKMPFSARQAWRLC